MNVLAFEKQVAVMPGSSFGEQARDFIRISLTVPDAVLQEAMERIAALANAPLITESIAPT